MNALLVRLQAAAQGVGIIISSISFNVQYKDV